VTIEPERTETGEIAPVLTAFLVNRECPWRCLMCDLWVDTLEAPAPEGSVAGQVDRALTAHPSVRRAKLYNAGSFFDDGAVSRVDRDRIAERVAGLKRIVVESTRRSSESPASASRGGSRQNGSRSPWAWKRRIPGSSRN
jgi:uncharacterized Fe-S cluster-containing MiaB family protein